MRAWEIIPGLLMRGEFHKRPQKLDELRELGVSTVVCLLQRLDPDLEGLDWLEYVWMPLSDGQVTDIQKAWAISWIVAERIRAGKTVLVHCISAKDRSALVVALTLVRLEKIPGLEALQRVQSIKPTTFTNRANVAFLRKVGPDDC